MTRAIGSLHLTRCIATLHDHQFFHEPLVLCPQRFFVSTNHLLGSMTSLSSLICFRVSYKTKILFVKVFEIWK